MRIYVCGPMTGLPEYNYPAFYKAAAEIRAKGHEVENPADNDSDTSKAWDYYIRMAIAQVIRCEAIAVLPGWQKSRGATLEVHIGRALKMPILDAATLEPITEESVCAEADRLVSCERQNDYGHPFHDFSRIAALWSVVLGKAITPQQVALCMIQVKVSRLCNAQKRDSVVDIAGYAKTLDMVNSYQP